MTLVFTSFALSCSVRLLVSGFLFFVINFCQLGVYQGKKSGGGYYVLVEFVAAFAIPS